MSVIAVDAPMQSLTGGGQLHSPVRWRRRKSPSPVSATSCQLPQQQHIHLLQQLQQQPLSQQQQQQRPRSIHLYRRSDPGLLGVMVDAELLHESDEIVDSRWDMSRTAVTTTSCGLTRTMSLKNSFLRQREPIWMQNVRQQLTDQLKCLDVRLEGHVAMLGELQEFYKRRAEVEMEYSRGMDKLVKQIMTRHKTEKQRRDSWPGYSTYTIWQTLLSTSRKLGRDHAVLADLYSSQMSSRLVDLTDDLQRIYKKCHEMACSGHEELVKVLTELQSSMKTYQMYHSECLQAETKLRQAETQRVKVEQQQNVGGVTGAKNAISRRFRNYEKVSEKKQTKYMESRMKAIKARNEYILCLEAANAAIQKYFNDDLNELINTMDYGYHSSLGRVVLSHVSADNNMLKSRQGCLDLINQRIRDLDQRADKQKFLELFAQPFTPPPPFEFHPHRNDEVTQLCAQKFTQDELLDRLNAINERLNSLRVESDEIWKTLETTDNTLLEAISREDYDVTSYFQEEQQVPKSPMDKQRIDRLETEKFYMTKFQGYLTVNNLMARLQAKYDCIEKALADSACLEQSARLPSVPPKPRRKKILGRDKLVGRPRLFGGTIVEYVEATGEDIPLVVKSCIRLINLYGMHHQGVFRISGAQHEITDFKNQFESGKDAVPDKVDGKDINSVAGVLKLYFRELKDPLFPSRIFDDLINCSCQHNFNSSQPADIAEGVAHLRTLLSTLPKPVIVVMRYLFSFLNHLSEFSDENMMDPYNLAVCFGPTLLPVPADRDQVQFQPHINEIVRTVIVHQDDIFPIIDPTPDKSTLYEKCLTVADEDGGPEDSTDNLSDDGDLGDMPVEEDVFYEPETKEAVAIYNFQGRNKRELTFSKGDVITLLEKLSNDWWEGTVANEEREGLIPDKYIRLINRKAKSESGQEELKRKSVESLPQSKSLERSVQVLGDNEDDDVMSSKSQPVVSSTSRVASDDCSPPNYNTLASDDSSSELLASVTPRSVNRKSSVTDASSSGSGACSGDWSPGCSTTALERRRETSSVDRETSSGLPPTVCDRRSKQQNCSVDSLLTELERLTEKPTVTDTRCAPGRCSTTDGQLTDNRSDQFEGFRLEKNYRSTSNWHKEDRGADSDYENVPDETATVQSDAKADELVKTRVETTENRTPDSGVSDDGKSTDDLSIDIDAALAEVMSGIELLRRDRRTPSPRKSSSQESSSLGDSDARIRSPSLLLSAMRDFKQTPDLVVGLPYGSRPSSVSPRVSNVSSVRSSVTNRNIDETVSPSSAMTTAEVFANIDRCTIKKATVTSSTGPSSAPPSACVITSNEHPLKSVGGGTSTVSSRAAWIKASSQDATTAYDGRGGVTIERRVPQSSARVASFTVETSHSSFRASSADNSPIRSASCRVSAADRRYNEHHQQPNTWSVFVPASEVQTIVVRRPDSEYLRSEATPKFDSLSSTSSTVVVTTSQIQSGTRPSFNLLPATDDGTLINAKESASGFVATTLPRSSPDKRLADATLGAIKPPIKAKPQMVKKPAPAPPPADAGELWRRLNELQVSASGAVDCHGNNGAAPVIPK